jgi:hypothetical protein
MRKYYSLLQDNDTSEYDPAVVLAFDLTNGLLMRVSMIACGTWTGTGWVNCNVMPTNVSADVEKVLDKLVTLREENLKLKEQLNEHNKTV